MTRNVKEFIEDSIGLIESENYKDLFDLWYDVYFLFDRTQDKEQLQEFFTILYDADIAIESVSRAAREELIKDRFKEYIEDRSFVNDSYITFVGCANNLRSFLFFDTAEIKQLFIDVCNELKLSSDNDEYTKVWLTP